MSRDEAKSQLGARSSPDPDRFDDPAQASKEQLQLQSYAHDQAEERVLISIRPVTYWQRMTIAELAESLARGKLTS